MAKARTAKKSPAEKSPLAKLPKSLRDNAKAAASAARKRLRASAREAFDRARAALGETARHLYELGTALTDLRREGYPEALGYTDFADLCARGLELARSTADRLLRAVELVPQERYVTLGRNNIDARLELADATEADDTEAILAGAEVSLWTDGPRFDVGAARTKAIREATQQVRDHRAEAGDGPTRGRTAAPDERRFVREASEGLTEKGSSARCGVRATKPGRPSVFDLEGLTAAEAARALRALGVKVSKPAKPRP